MAMISPQSPHKGAHKKTAKSLYCARSLWSDLADRVVVPSTQRELRGCTDQASLEI